MQMSFEAEPINVSAYENFWAAMSVGVLKEKTWRLEYDPWEGFVLEADRRRVLIMLKNMAEPSLEIQAYVGRALVPDATFEKLAQGVCFEVRFTHDEEGPFMEFEFPTAHSS